jgi:hypothetical protein
MSVKPVLAGAASVLLLAAAGACTPTVQLQAPKDPIRIDLNIKIEQEVRVKIDRELEDTIARNPDLF